jgi:uncharacterized protein
MTRRTFDPRRLDVAGFAETGERLEGGLDADALPRLAASTLAPSDAPRPPVAWQAVGELRPVAGGAPEVGLHLEASTVVTLECQRCLQPMREPLHVDRWFRFAATEDEAARLDEDAEDDVLVLSRTFDLQELLEDELILSLPLVPRHEVCPEPLPAPENDEAAAESPFAALAALRRGGG